MSSAVTGKGVPVKVPSRSSRLSVLRLVRMAVAFVVVAGSLGLATVAATAQSSGGSCPSDGAPAYSDVSEDSYAYDDSRCLRELGISDAGDIYRPGDDMTRSEMAGFMANAYAALTGVEAPVVDHVFGDVEGDPNADDIARISGLMITQGTSDTTYSPDNPVVRGHMALFLARMFKAATGSDAAAGDTPFTDIGDRPAEEQAAIGAIYALGVTTGTTDTTYSPHSNVTREQMASFVARMYRAIDAIPDPTEAPGAPTGVEVALSGDDGDALDVSWTEPEESGTSDVTGYVVQWKSGDDDYSVDNQSSVEGTSVSFDGLSRGDAYTFRVAAVSDDGQSDWSGEASGTPAVAPGLVSELTSVPGNGTLALSWTAPDDDGGSEITGYLVSWRTGRQPSADTADVAGDATGYTITGLDNSKNYSVWVQAVNDAGTGESASVPAGTDSVAVTPAPTAATAPQNLTVTPEGGALFLTWQEPADSGGTVLINYTHERRCGTTTAWGNATSKEHFTTKEVQDERITGLTNGVACEVRVRANSYNDANDNDTQDTATEPTLNSPWAVGSGTPVTLPGVLSSSNVTITTAHQSLQLTWDAPGSDGGSDITGYKITWNAGVLREAIVPAEPRMYTITGLTNGYQYTITIIPINAVGEATGATGAGFAIPVPVPAAPTNVQAAPPPVVTGEAHSDTTLVVTWNAPASNGTGAVTGYTVQARTSAVLNADGSVATAAGDWDAGTVGTVDVANRTVTITGLTSGTSYDVRVQASNVDADGNGGSGPFGHTSGTPATLPAVVATVNVLPGYTSLDVEWAPPAANGSDITHYLVRYAQNRTGNEPFSGDIRVNAPANRIRLTGLAVGVPYVIQIQAVNGIGTGLNAATDFTGTTGLYPEAPSSVTAVPKADGDGTALTVTWSTVTQTNGTGDVASYTVETQTGTGAWTPFTATIGATDTTVDVTGLTDDTTYQVRVRAVSTAGANGIPGYAAPVKTANVPTAPANVTAVLDSTTSSTINVTWDSIPAETETDITGYVVTWYNSTDLLEGSRGDAAVSGAGTGEYSITGLDPGTYEVRVVAVNHVGKSAEGEPTTDPVVPEPTP